jgi:A/G-specific adenine glycosylase
MVQMTDFQKYIWDFYCTQGRAFAWRNVDNPYYVLVSEIMLQQTQTHRVVEKYEQFLSTFPTIFDLAKASLQDVLIVWQGLGYYRRARYLHQTAMIIVSEYNGVIPNDPAILETFPGIGSATASSICAFAFNRPTIFIETNIRAVFIHSFFGAKNNVTDKDLMPLIAATVDNDNPREWYYALMDYGVFLKSQYTNPSRKSAHYNKQSKFDGSDRQIRAAILKLIIEKNSITKTVIIHTINIEQARTEKILQKLVAEKFITESSENEYSIV